MKNGPLAVVSVGFAVLLAGLGCKRNGADAIGRPCDLTVAAGDSQAVVNTASGECPTGICLKPVLAPTGRTLDPPVGGTCTAGCSSDSDCDGELRDPNSPQDTRCQSGFFCGVSFVRGPLCCKRLCMCKDFLEPSGLQTPIACTGPDALATCQESAGSTPTAGVGQETDLYMAVSPVRRLDLVFMIDNSPSMAPKVAKLNKSFPSLLAALEDPSDGTYPDLRVAIIDSDLGTGGRYDTGPCGPNSSNNQSSFGDIGDFQMRGATGCGVTDSNALWLEYTKGSPINYKNPAGGDIAQVFGCLASNLGTVGCGEEHQLQAFEFALVAQNLHGSTSEPARGGAQNSFLRPQADLGLVFLSDEDDCSAATNDGMFGDIPDLRNESASLRCATRAHKCSGQNLTNSPPGYPTVAKFETGFANCSARTDACSNQTTNYGAITDTSVPTDCSPLKDIPSMANEIKSLKADPSNQILVAGIFGWPRMMVDTSGKPVVDSDGKNQFDMANAKYKIDQTPNPNTADTAHPQIWDYWPVCYDPDHLPKGGADSFDLDAWGWGAEGGLRMSAFIDEFGDNGLKYSICEPDFTLAMEGIGNAFAKKLQNLCVSFKLMDVDPVTPGLQPDCRVVYRTPQIDPNTSQMTYVENPQSLPMCPPGATKDTVTSDCWQIVYDTAKCPGTGQMISVVRTAAEIAGGPLAEGTKIEMQCWTCPDLVSSPGCDY